MPVSGRVGLRGLGAALAYAALLWSCTGKSAAPDAGSTAGTSGGTTTGNSCPTPQQTACTSQADCDSRDNIDLISACMPGAGGTVCTYRAQNKANCRPDEPVVTLQVNVSQAVTLTPHSLMVRALYPVRTDGSAPTCADLLAYGDLPDGGPQIDADPALNFSLWNAVPVNTAPGLHTFSVSQDLVRGDEALIEVEAFSGGVDTTSHLPIGVRLAKGCVEHVSITEQATPAQNISINLQ